MTRLKVSRENLRVRLRTIFPKLQGPWLRKRSGYEKSFANCMGAKVVKSRYWDCEWKGHRLELKKGKHGVWLDAVRYSEMLLAQSEGARKKVDMVFIRYEGIQANELLVVDSDEVISKLGLKKADARVLRRISRSVPHSLNAQVNLTTADLREIATFSVSR